MKRVLSLLLAVVMILSLAACGANGSTGGNDAEAKKITIWAWDPNFNVAIMEEAKARYQESNPGVEIEIVDIAKGDLEQKLHTNLASGVTDTLPDIVLIEDYNAQKYLASYPGSFADLTGKIPHDDFVDYKVELMSMNGNVYGVPFDSGVSGFFYRTDILAEAGYDAEDLENITWSEFIEIGKKVKETTGKAMLAFDPNDGGLMRVMLQSAGQWYFNKDGSPNLANNEAIKVAIQTYKDILEADITKATSGWTEWVGAFNSGDSASVITGVWIIGSVKAGEDQAGNWAVAPTPRLDVAGSKNASNLGGSSWYVLDSSKAKNTAIDFLKSTFASDVDFYQKILVDRGAVGSFKPSQTGEAYVSDDAFFGGQKVYSDMSKYMAEIPAINYGMYTYEADAAIFNIMQDIYNGGDITELLKDAEETLKSQM